MSNMSNSFETGSIETRSINAKSNKLDKLDTDATRSAEFFESSTSSTIQPIDPASAEPVMITGRSPQGTVQSRPSITPRSTTSSNTSETTDRSEVELEPTAGNQSRQNKYLGVMQPNDNNNDDHSNRRKQIEQDHIEQSASIDLRETIDPEEAEIDESSDIDEDAGRSPLIRGIMSILVAAIAVGAVAAAVNFAIFLLVNPQTLFLSQKGASCKAKINGQWQTNWGKIAFQEQPNSKTVTGEYTYQNLNRGKVEGKLEGQLTGDTLNFDWQETAQRGQKSLQGRGSFLFTNDCQSFSGSSGLEQSHTGWGNWSGQVLEVVPISQ
jgi:hypothetical protein